MPVELRCLPGWTTYQHCTGQRRGHLHTMASTPYTTVAAGTSWSTPTCKPSGLHTSAPGSHSVRWRSPQWSSWRLCCHTARLSFDGQKRQEMCHGDSISITISWYQLSSFCVCTPWRSVLRTRPSVCTGMFHRSKLTYPKMRMRTRRMKTAGSHFPASNQSPQALGCLPYLTLPIFFWLSWPCPTTWLFRPGLGVQHLSHGPLEIPVQGFPYIILLKYCGAINEVIYHLIIIKNFGQKSSFRCSVFTKSW